MSSAPLRSGAPAPLLLAHRGWRAAGPENSLRSVVEAFRRCDGAEVDVLVTAEGVPVLRHDDRLTEGTPVRALRLAELRTLSGTDADDLPEVSRVLDAIEGVGTSTARWNLELKVPGAARALRPLAARLHRVVFTSFFVAEVLDALAWFPDRPCGLLLAHPTPGFVPSGLSLLSVRHSVLPDLRRAHPTTPIWAWTINDREAAERAREARCEALIGDDVDAMRAWLTVPQK